MASIQNGNPMVYPVVSGTAAWLSNDQKQGSLSDDQLVGVELGGFIMPVDANTFAYVPGNNRSLQFIHYDESTSITARAERLLGELGELGVMIPEPVTIRAYLARHSEITDVVRDVIRLAKVRFSPDSQLSLEVYIDPEINDQYLTVYVRKNRYDKATLDLIDTLSDEIASQLTGKSGWLLVSTDFHMPK